MPRFYWKIIIDPAAGSGVAIIGVNNPHLKTIPDEYKICEPIPNHPLLENIYYPEDIVKGYMWACRYRLKHSEISNPIHPSPAGLGVQNHLMVI